MARFLDITGRQFGKLIVLSLLEETRKDVNKKWMCRCDCGTQVVRDGRSLVKKEKKGGISSCGTCTEIKNSSLEGTQFGRLTVIKKSDKAGYWYCICECGQERSVWGFSLLRGTTKSCGCLSRNLTTQRNRMNATHNMRGTRLYHIWDTMKARCYRPNSKDFKNYGARGIAICQEWRNDFLTFYHWANVHGYESHLTLDRKDVNGNYEPSNCRWATAKEQGNNTRVNRHITINGQKKTIAEWSDETGIGQKTLRYRIVTGWDEKDLLLPVGVHKVYITVGEETKTIKEWSKEKGISETVISKRYKSGVREDDLFKYKKRESKATHVQLKLEL
jgi:hypothetical protein